MRIIAGDYKGRRLYAPQDNKIRPTTDKVKEALFSILANHIYDADVLDLFAGTGGLGLEALSRGARRCWFCDNSRDSIRLLRENISYCRADEKAVVLTGDFRKILQNLNTSMDLIFLDPPYGRNLLPECFELIGEFGCLAEGGMIIAEHRREEVLPEELGGFEKIKERKYGTVMLSIYLSSRKEKEELEKDTAL